MTTTPATTPGRSGAEDLKEASGHLRGTLAAELAQDSESFSHDAYQLLKFHGIYQQDDRDQRRARTQKKLPLAYACMVRTSLPGGAMSGTQWLALDRLTDKLGNGTLRVTTRQDIQFHFVSKSDLRPLVASMNEALITTKGACGDVVRNVVSCPAPHHDRRQHLLLEAALRTANQFRYKTGAYYELWVDGEKAVTALEPEVPEGEREPIYGDTYLPRKFKFGFAWPGDNCIDVYSQDVGIVPYGEIGEEGPEAYVVLAGGGLGLNHSREDDTYPRLATPFFLVPPELLGPTAEAIVTTQRDYGNRADRQRARLKYTIDERGEDWFRAEVQDRVGQPLAEAPPLPPWRDTDDHLGWFEQPDGRWFLGVHVDSGRVVDTDASRIRTALREVVEAYGPDVRLTARQDVLLCGLDAADRAGVERILRRHDVPLAEELRPVRRLAMACPALPSCGQALGEAERVLPQVVDGIQAELDKRGLGELPVTVNMTGCPNGCARPYVAEIGVVGRTKTTYDLYVGGAAGGDRMAQRVAQDVKLADLPLALGPLLDRYAAAAEPGEGFGDFCDRVGVAELALSLPRLERRRGRAGQAPG